MKAVLLTTAEYASVSNDGKLSICGIFDSIQASEFPAISPRLYLVAQFRATQNEYGKLFQVRFQLENEKEETLLDLSGAGEVPYSDLGLTVLMNQVVTLNNIQFDEPSNYLFKVLMKDEYQEGYEIAAELPFPVVRSKNSTNKV